MADVSFAGFPLPKVGGGEALTYADLKVNCGETEETSVTGWQALADSIVELDEAGTFSRFVVYASDWLIGDLEVNETGWYDNDNIDNDHCLNTTPFDFGHAVQIYVTDAELDPQINFAGEVKQAPTVTDLADVMGIANCSPKKIYAEDLIVNCGETEDTSGEGWQALADSIVMLDENGTYVRDIVYASAWLIGDLEVKEVGWYDNDSIDDDHCYNHSEDLCWEAGQGFQVCVLDDLGATITIKSALAKDAE